MLATLTIHGVTPGVRLMTENPEMVYATFAVLMLSNLLMYPSCVITTRMFSFLLRIPEQLLMGVHRGAVHPRIIRIAGQPV